MAGRAQPLPSFLSRQVAAARHFYFGPPTQGTREFGVVCGGWERTAPDYRIDRATFRYRAVEFVAGGRGTLRMHDREFPLNRGSVFAYGPGVAHEIATDPAEPLAKYFVDLSGTGVKSALAEAGVHPGSCLVVADPAEVQAGFERLIEAGRRGTPTAARLAALQAQSILLVLSEVRLPGGAPDTLSRETFLRCRDYLERHCSTLRTAEEAAAGCRIAPAYLSRLFRRYAGQPPYRFLMRLKMNEAAALLERQGLNVSETAEAFGMDPFHFSRVFKRVHGRAPMQFLSATRP